MKRDPLISKSGVLDNETDFIADMSLISLEEARAVLCVYMLCCALDGSMDSRDFVLWKSLLLKVRALLAAAHNLPQTLTQFHDWFRTLQVEEKSQSEADGKKVTVVSKFACNVVCQRFRNCHPITCETLTACFDPTAHKKLRNRQMQPQRLLVQSLR